MKQHKKSLTRWMGMASILLMVAGILAVPPTATGGIFDDWDYRAKLTFSQPLDATVTNFPLLVRLDSIPGFSYDGSLSDGDDVRFADADESVALDYEIERFDSSGNSVAWVRVPEIAGTNDFIYVYWGNVTNAAPSTTNGAVWDDDYLAVWHLDQTNSAGAFTESSGNGPDGVNVSCLPTDGVAAGAQDLNGTRRIEVTGLSSTHQTYTFSFWMNTTSTSTDGRIIDIQSGRFLIGLSSGGVWYYNNNTWRPKVGDGLNNGQWRHIAFVFRADQAQADVYIDGELAESDQLYNPQQNIGGTSRIGSTFNSVNQPYDGLLDEFRVAETARGSNYIYASWLNQKPGSDFVTYGEAEMTGDLRVEAHEPSGTTPYGAMVNGLLLSDGDAQPTEVYLCWGESDPQTTDRNDWDYNVLLGDQFESGDPIASWLALPPNTSVVYRLYATNATGSAWSKTTRAVTTYHAWYVASGGSNGEGKSWASAYTNLQDVLDVVDERSMIYLAGETFNLGESLVWNNVTDVFIRGGYAGNDVGGLPGDRDLDQTPTMITRAANFESRLLTVEGVNGGVLDGVTLSGAYHRNASGVVRGGAMSILNSSLEIVDCVFSDNDARSTGNDHVWGGGIYADSSTVTILRTLFSGNAAIGEGSSALSRSHGGALASENSTVNVLDCQFIDNTANGGLQAARGGAIYLIGGPGIISNALMSGNSAGPPQRPRGYGGAIYVNANTVISDSTIVSNRVWDLQEGGGGGVYMTGGVLRNSLVADNRGDHQPGGGIFATGGVIENTTVAGNRVTAPLVAGVFLSGATPTVINSIFHGNYRDFDEMDVSVSDTGGAITYSGTFPERAGEGNTDTDPRFLDPHQGDYRLRPDSPAIDSAFELEWMANAVDLDGNPRIRNAAPDMGCYESAASDEGPFRIGLTADVRAGIDELTVVFTATAAGANTNGLIYRWDFDNSGLFDVEGGDRRVVTNVYSPGVYTVRLRVENDAPDADTLILTDYVVVSASNIYVGSGGNNSDGLSWATAFHEVQTALDYAVSSSRIHLAGETFGVTETLNWGGGHNDVQILGGYEANPVTVGPGPRDPQAWPTVIERSGGSQIRIMRIASITNGLMEHVTISDGYMPTTSGGVAVGGAGLWIQNAHLAIDDCVISNNIARAAGNDYVWGGGAYAQNAALIFRRTRFHSNRAGETGGASNTRAHGGGLASQNSSIEVLNCQFINNQVNGDNHGSYGGGIYMTEGSGVISNAFMTGNIGGPQLNRPRGYGGAVYLTAGTLVTDCTIVSNKVWDAQAGGGGGVYMTGGTLRNSLVADNRGEEQNGGGIFATGGLIENTTVAGNRVAESGLVAGTFLSGANPTVVNSVFGNNIREFDNQDVSVSTEGGSLTYSCTIPGRSGTGNTGADPEFVDPGAGNYRLRPSSPAIDMAIELGWMTDAFDLDGNARIRGDGPDIGCYEAPGPGEGPLSIGFSADKTLGLDTLAVVFTASAIGANTNGLNYEWDFDDNGTFDAQGSDRRVVTNIYSPGIWSVSLRVTNEDDAEDVLIRADYIHVSASELYVSSAGDDSNGFSWQTAFHNIQSALNFAAYSNTIYFAGETHMVTQTLIWSEQNDVVIIGGYEADVGTVGPGPNDPEQWPTTIRRDAGAGQFRIWDIGALSTCRLAQVNVADGHAYTTVGPIAGGGARILNSVLEIVDCTFANNQSQATGNDYVWGGALYVNNSTLDIIRTLFIGNAATNAAFSSNCRAHGGAIAAEDGSTLRILESRFLDNVADAGNHGSMGGAVYLTGGTALIRNTLMAGNRASPNGSRHRGRGGALYMTSGTILESSTIVSNLVWNDGSYYSNTAGGVYLAGGSVTNTIVYLNENRSGTPVASDVYSADWSRFAYSCAPELPDGVNGNIIANPLFVDAGAGDFQLQQGSSCFNTGTNLAWMVGATDLAGNPRAMLGGRVVDMGAYEIQPPAGTVFLMR